jgi:hypothetical protein
MFMSNEKLDSRKFHVEARIWFDGIGSPMQGQLLPSTGDTSLVSDLTTSGWTVMALPTCHSIRA